MNISSTLLGFWEYWGIYSAKRRSGGHPRWAQPTRARLGFLARHGGFCSVRESWVMGSSGVRAMPHGPDRWAVKIQDRRPSVVSRWESPLRGWQAWRSDMKSPFSVQP